jgi:hypothetical protein
MLKEEFGFLRLLVCFEWELRQFGANDPLQNSTVYSMTKNYLKAFKAYENSIK